MNKTMALKLILWAIAIYHFFLGIVSSLSFDVAQQIALTVFGMRVEPSFQVAYLAKMLGIYAAIFGAIVAGVAMNVEKNGFALKVIVVLYAVRVLNRLLFFNDLHQAFGVTEQRNVIEMILPAFFGLSVLLLAPKSIKTQAAVS